MVPTGLMVLVLKVLKVQVLEVLPLELLLRPVVISNRCS